MFHGNGNGYGSGGGQAPWPPPPGSQASIDPPSTFKRSKQGLEWYQTQVYWPTPWIPLSENIGIQPRRRPIQDVLNGAANAVVNRTIQIDIPSAVYALTGSATPSDGSALPNNLHPLDTFLIQFTHNTGDRLDTQAALARSLIGTAERPAMIGGVGWNFDRGGTIQVDVTPLRANMRISVTCWVIEIRGPVNYTPG